MQYDKILILDFGSQVTQLIARRIRELNVYCEIHPHDVDIEFIKSYNPKGIILSGGPCSVYAKDAPQIDEQIFNLGLPIFGICYGMQIMALKLGGEVLGSDIREFGYAKIYPVVYAKGANLLLNHITDGTDTDGRSYINVWMSHGDSVKKIPQGFEIVGSSKDCKVAIMADMSRKFYAVQFHPEVTHTVQGSKIISHFVLDICKATPNFNMPNYLNDAVTEIKTSVAGDKVILALSGGVDSSVLALLIKKAIGDNLICIFVDTGLLRYNEGNLVMDAYQNVGLNVIKIDAKETFYKELQGVTDPEQKRKIIGRLFIEIFEREANKIDGVKWLAQGTIYPDVIESAGSKTKKAHNIKSHHNVGGLPERLNLKLLEPLRELFKDEVRKLGLELGLPKELINRHPFPGPGLAVRILCEVKPEFVELLQKADKIFIDELITQGYYAKVSQAFVVFLPIKSVGVMGDGRTYDYVVALRAVETLDFMTATVANLPMEFITHVANRIINEVKGINRVTYDVSGKPPSTIEWE